MTQNASMEHQPSGESSGNGREDAENEELIMKQEAYLAVLRALRARSIHTSLGHDEPKIFPQLREFLGICDLDHTRLSMMLITEELIGDAGGSNPDAQPAHDAPGTSPVPHPAAQGCTDAAVLPSRQQPTEGRIRSLEQDAYEGLVRAYNFMATRRTNIDWDNQLDIFDELRELLRIRNDNCSQVREAGGPNPAQAPAVDAPSAEPHHPAAQTIGASSGPASADSPDCQPLRPRFRSPIDLTYGSQYEMEQLALQQNLPISRRDDEGAADDGHEAEADDDDEESASDQSDDPERRPEGDN